MIRVRVGVVGVTGRMGREIVALGAESSGVSITAGVSPDSLSGIPSAGFVKVEKMENLDSSACDVIVDFSLPQAFDATVAWCVKYKKPLVSGVTGLTLVNKEGLKKAGNAIPILWSPNMSLGVAVLAKALDALKDLADFDFQIEETHHKDKKDRPSGTALLLQERLTKSIGKSCPEPLSIRGGGVFGHHRVWALGAEETLVFEHAAMNRRVFARGALRAATWIVSKSPGLYQVSDIFED